VRAREGVRRGGLGSHRPPAREDTGRARAHGHRHDALLGAGPDDPLLRGGAALEHGSTGIYNVVDDEPAAVREWLPAFAADVGAKPPRRVPAWVGRLLAGSAGVAGMTTQRGASNAKAKRELGWSPQHASWRQGFTAGDAGADSR
jgi:nucleoside-diphosphate-sugar epimerase